MTAGVVGVAGINVVTRRRAHTDGTQPRLVPPGAATVSLSPKLLYPAKASSLTQGPENALVLEVGPAAATQMTCGASQYAVKIRPAPVILMVSLPADTTTTIPCRCA